MYFSDSLYFNDQCVASEVLGIYSGRDGVVIGTMVLPVGVTLSGLDYTLVMDDGKVLDICAVQSTGQAHQAKAVEFVSARAIRESARAVLEQLEAREQAAR